MRRLLCRPLIEPALPVAQAVVGGVLIGIREAWVVVDSGDERVDASLSSHDLGGEMDQFRGEFANQMRSQESLVFRRRRA